MKFKLKIKSGPEEGDERIVDGFLWFPKYLDREWRWLEHAKWLQIVRRLTQIVPDSGYSPGQTYLSWCDTEWVNPPLTEGKTRCGVKSQSDNKKPIAPPPSPNSHLRCGVKIKQGKDCSLGFNGKFFKTTKKYIRACSDDNIYEADHEDMPDSEWTVCVETTEKKGE